MDPADHAQRKDGQMINHFCDVAKRLGVYVSIPYVEVDDLEGSASNASASFFPPDKTAFYNSISFVGPEGTVLTHYRKVNLWPLVDHSW